MRKRVAWALALVVLIVAAGGVVWWRARDDADDCESNRANAEAAPDRAGRGDGGTVVAVLGDSFTTGLGLDDPTDAWPYVLSDDLGWDAHLDGFGGSGFATDSPCGEDDYVSRADQVPANADMVIVQGGLNDVRTNATGVPESVVDVVSRVRERAPRAAVVVLGPSVVPYFNEADTRRVADEVEQGAEVAGAAYVDALTWVSATVDGVHPTAAAAEQYAANLRKALTSALR